MTLVNDTQETATGRLVLAWEPGHDRPVVQAETRFEVAPVGQSNRVLELTSPSEAGKYLLVARAFWDGKPWSPTISRREVRIGTVKARP